MATKRSIEDTLDAILEQLVTLNGKVIGGPDAPPPAEKKVKKTETLPAENAATQAPAISREDLGKALVTFAKANMEGAKALLLKYKAEKLDGVAASDYPALLKDVQEALKPATAESLL